MAVVKTLGVVIVVLLALWLIFGLIHILTGLISSLLGVFIVVAICYAAYHYFKKR
jgi:hypothetical protein